MSKIDTAQDKRRQEVLSRLLSVLKSKALETASGRQNIIDESTLRTAVYEESAPQMMNAE